ncbi:MAG: methyltransferase regulatory domain-containing protein [Alphaproteobacteria bacterium]|nr:methyltransferase regulatory domain-containing protein [Alphaproteobacteria bacterium]MCL2505213.1 methyltransferase regulatory domain-containing protein [Alphaproteobacteria bacterium]
MRLLSSLSPVSLRYVVALRGYLASKSADGSFSYADAACHNPEALACLAASNPDGVFFGFIQDNSLYQAALNLAKSRKVSNITFFHGSASQILHNINSNAVSLPQLDFMTADETVVPLSADDRIAIFNIADKCVKQGGIFVTAYNLYSGDSDLISLKFLIQQFAPEMTAAQKSEFLLELKDLACILLSKHPDLEKALDKAISDNSPQSFFFLFEGEAVQSKSFDTLVAASARNFVYGGDTRLQRNFVEFSVPKRAQNIVVSCKDNLLYEAIKDVALNSSARHDIWIKQPSSYSSNLIELFGSCAYGLIDHNEIVPQSFLMNGTSIDLSSPIFQNITKIMKILPVGIGDVLSHELCHGETPERILEVFQLLVACGFAVPMRGSKEAIVIENKSSLKFSGPYNPFLAETEITGREVLLSSPVAGCPIVISAREALVMQALHRVGFATVIDYMLPVLQRLSYTPFSFDILGSEAVSEDLARNMVISVVQSNLIEWYAYALMHTED